MGTTIGTAGSYQNKGNTIAKATDGSLSTYFDAPTASGAWVGLDLGSAKVVSAVAFAPRSGYASRMVGGVVQASADPTFATNVLTAYTIAAAPASGKLTTVATATATAYRYWRYLGPTNGDCNIAELQLFAPSTVPVQRMGTTIGTAGSYQNKGNTIAKATDGSLSTYFDGPTANGDWVGLDLGAAESISQFKFAPRSGYASRMVGGTFQVSTTADFSSGVTTLYTITTAPASGSLTTVTLASPVTARYVRYLSPNGSNGDIAEFQVFG
jgi:predicted phage tail protein